METRIRPVTPIPIGKLLSAQLPPTTLINDKKRRAEVFAECCRFVCPGFKVEGAFRKIMKYFSMQKVVLELEKAFC